MLQNINILKPIFLTKNGKKYRFLKIFPKNYDFILKFHKKILENKKEYFQNNNVLFLFIYI